MLSLTPMARDFVGAHGLRETGIVTRCETLVSERQLEIVSHLFEVAYETRCSFQDHRYRVTFFTPLRGETIHEYLKRRVFYVGHTSFLANLCTDESHEPDGLVLMPDGGLAVYCDNYVQKTVYSSIERVLERDALLDSRKYEFVGTIIFKPSVTQKDIIARLRVFATYAPASDNENTLLIANDKVCLLQWWHRFYMPSFMVQEKDCTMRVFSDRTEAFEEVRAVFDPTMLRSVVIETPNRC